MTKLTIKLTDANQDRVRAFIATYLSTKIRSYIVTYNTIVINFVKEI